MPYRTRTYIAGDWDHDKEAIDKLYQWRNSKFWFFDFIDAHEYTQARDSSLNCSIKKSQKERLDRSKTFVLIVGEYTRKVTAGSCQYCTSNNSYLGYCVRGHRLDFRSYIEYECEEAIKADMNIIVLYNSNFIRKEWCPMVLREKGDHLPMLKNNEWDFKEIRKVLNNYFWN